MNEYCGKTPFYETIQIDNNLSIKFYTIDNPITFKVNGFEKVGKGWKIFLKSEDFDITKIESKQDYDRRIFNDYVSENLIIIDSKVVTPFGEFTSHSSTGRYLGVLGIAVQLNKKIFFKKTDPMTGELYNREDFQQDTRIHIFDRITGTATHYKLLTIKKFPNHLKLYLVSDGL